MKLPQLRKARRGFTLIELLTVIAIIGILAGMVIPGVQFAKQIAQRTAASSNAGQIAKSYYAYAFASGSDSKTFSTTLLQNVGGGVSVNGWALALASKASMNTPDPWFIKTDQALEAVNIWPLQVADLSNPTKPVIDSNFANAKPKSWCVVAAASKNDANASTYPLLWTRGLLGGNTAWNLNSPWAGKGGHVAYLDGHVAWYEKTIDDNSGQGVFINYTTRKATSNIQEAIGTNAQILYDNAN